MLRVNDIGPLGLILFVTLTYVSAATKIREKDLQVITLQEGKLTTAHRGYPVDQLKCTSNCGHAPKTVQCYNRGWDGQAVNWECKASLPGGITFGNLDVSCEGYSYPDDEYITVGSCGLTYNLVGSANGQKSEYRSSRTYKADDETSVIQTLLTWVVVIVLLYYFVSMCGRGTENQYARSDDHYADDDRGTGYYGGTGGYPNAGPGFRPDYSSAPSGGCGGARAPPPYRNDGPGFWSGLGAGGFLGYMFGSQNNAYNYGGRDAYYSRPRYTNNDSSWFGSSSGTGASSSSTSNHQSSSGYARTSRR